MRSLQQLRDSIAIMLLKDNEGGEKKSNVPKGFEKFFKKKEEEGKAPEKGTEETKKGETKKEQKKEEQLSDDEDVGKSSQKEKDP